MKRILMISKIIIARKAGRNPVRGLPIVFNTLVLTLMITSLGLPPVAKLAPAREAIRYYMEVLNPRLTVCKGDTVEYRVKVFYVEAAEPGKPWAKPGVKVTALSSNTDVGDFSNDWAITGFGYEDMLTAGFFFEAREPGVTDLFFEGLAVNKVASSYVDFPIRVTVIPCKFKVTASSQFSKCYEGGACLSLTVAVVDGLLSADENGYFTGTAPVLWLSSTVIPHFKSVVTVGSGNVNMRGTLNQRGQLMLEMEYQPVSWTEENTGPLGMVAGSSQTVNLSSLSFTVPSTERGASIKVNQVLSDEADSIDGSANVHVIQLDGAQ